MIFVWENLGKIKKQIKRWCIILVKFLDVELSNYVTGRKTTYFAQDQVFPGHQSRMQPPVISILKAHPAHTTPPDFFLTSYITHNINFRSSKIPNSDTSSNFQYCIWTSCYSSMWYLHSRAFRKLLLAWSLHPGVSLMSPPYSGQLHKRSLFFILFQTSNISAPHKLDI